MSSLPSPAIAAAPKRAHWLVTTNYRMRIFSLGIAFVSVALDKWGQASIATWLALVLVFLLYPHLAYWRTLRAADMQKTELNNLVIDSAMIGVVIAALHFPLWLTFTLWLGSSMNSAICTGPRGLLVATATLLASTLAGIAVFGLRVVPEMSWPSTVFLIIGMSAYQIAIALAGHWRNVQLRQAREKLRLGEQALNDSNDKLQQQLAEVNRLQAQLNEQAIRDPLTGLFNRRYLETIVPHELARCARDGSSLTLMMIDIDHFKSVNDRYGHQGGDEVLKALASLLTNSVRASDVACRFGGEEFLLLLPNMGRAAAVERAQQWRSDFAAMAVDSNGAVIRATLSIGVAIHPEHGMDLHALVGAADVALYQAKEQGRDRVVVCDAGPIIMA